VCGSKLSCERITWREQFVGHCIAGCHGFHQLSKHPCCCYICCEAASTGPGSGRLLKPCQILPWWCRLGAWVDLLLLLKDPTGNECNDDDDE
jgi:hypothetical protein